MQSAQDPGLYILDCAFSVLVIGTLVVFVWRGTWVICDLVIYPDDTRMTAWSSLVRKFHLFIFVYDLDTNEWNKSSFNRICTMNSDFE